MELTVLACIAGSPIASERRSALGRLMSSGRGVLGATRISVLARTPDRPDAPVEIAAAGDGPPAYRWTPTDRSTVDAAMDSTRVAVFPIRGEPGAPAPGPGDHRGWGAVAHLPDGRGVLLGQWDACSEIGPLELETLCQLASFASRALCHQAQRSAAEAAPTQVRRLLTALADVDGATCDHSVETADLAVRIGRTLGLDRPGLGELKLGALLHDVGKLCVPSEILVKPGPLSDAEWRLVRRHPQLGADIVAAVPGLEAVALVVLLHHERPDGGGYPYGLPLRRIPVASRIVSVCDAYDAMTSDRPYREPLESDEAVEELRHRGGSQFDPQVIEGLASVIRRDSPILA